MLRYHARLHQLTLGSSPYKKVKLFKKNLSIRNEIKGKPYILRIGWDSICSDELNDLWSDVSQQYLLSILKESKYIFWRYADHPSQYYTLLTLKDIIQKRIVALAVVKCLGHEMIVFDLVVIDGYEVFSSFWNMLELYAIKMKTKALNIWINVEENAARYLIEFDYKIVEDVPLVIKVISTDKISQHEFFKKYIYRMGDLL